MIHFTGLRGQGQRGDRQDVARVDRDLAAEAAADVVGLDPDVVLVDRQAGAAGGEGQDGPDRVRRLARQVERRLLADRVPVGDMAVDRGRLQIRGM